MDMARFCQENDFSPLPTEPDALAREQIEALRSRQSGTERAADIRREMQEVMMDHVGVFREGPGMRRALEVVKELQARFKRVAVDDKGKRFNTDLLETWELGALLDSAEVTVVAALNRTESRGGHYREDYPQRDDRRWLKHSLASRQDGKIRLRYKSVKVTDYKPQERVY
jgi:succinate dehydrogenase / fumarate reductase flavoprotein subunit